VGERRLGLAEEFGGGGDSHGQVRGRVAQRDERGAGARERGDLGDLALDTDRAEPADPICDLAGDRPNRPRILWAGRLTHGLSRTVAMRRESMPTKAGRLALARS